MFFEFLNAVISLDVNWLAWLFFANLHYLFLFVAVGFFFFGPKMRKAAISALLLAFSAWALVDFQNISGWAILVGGFLAIFYITKIAVLTFAEDVPYLKKHLVLVSELHFVSILIFYNLFLR